MNKKINDKFIQYCYKNGVELGEGILFAIAVTLQEQGTLAALYNTMGGKKYREMELNFTHYDRETQTYTLRVPVFGENEYNTAIFSKFLEKLSFKGLSSNGIKNNETSFDIFKEKKKLLEPAFFDLMRNINNLDIDKLVSVVINYYTKTEFKTILHKYLENGAESDYKSLDDDKPTEPKFKMR